MSGIETDPPFASPGVLFVLPGPRTHSAAVEARRLAASNLAEALGRRLGCDAEILTSEGVLTPDQVRAGSVHPAHPNTGGKLTRHLPGPVRVLIGDLRAWWGAGKMRTAAKRISSHNGHRLVVQMHRRFQTSGLLLARRMGVPFVLRIEALEVREEAAWGTRRPGWGRAVESWGELRLAGQADLCASVSEVVDDQLAEAGIPRHHRAVVPNGVDLSAFRPGLPDPALRRSHGLDGRFVVGWVGGFRPFHGLDLIPEIARELRTRIPQAVLCLVGTGPLRDDVERAIAGMEDVVRLLPAVPPHEVPRWIRTFDACVLLASEGEFHYSPLKMYEYLGCGRPVVAPRVGEPQLVLSDGKEGFLVPSQDARATVEALERLAEDPGLRQWMGTQARRTAERVGSWDARAQELLGALEARGLTLAETGSGRG